MGIQNNSAIASTQRDKVALNKFEPNNNPLDMIAIISDNMSELTTKEILVQEIEVAYNTEVIETNLLPKDEENVINEYRKTEPIVKKVEIGTSEFLAEYGLHIGDNVYTKVDTNMHAQADGESATIAIVYQYIDLKLEGENEEWCRVSIGGIDGYIK